MWRIKFSLRGLLIFCLATALLAANFTPWRHSDLELSAAMLKRIQHSSLPLDPSVAVSQKTVKDAVTKGWPAIVYIQHKNPFSSVAGALAGTLTTGWEVTYESYFDYVGLVINFCVATVLLTGCYVAAVRFDSSRGRSCQIQDSPKTTTLCNAKTKNERT